MTAAAVSLALVAGMTESASAEGPDLETQFVERINAFRLVSGLPPVTVDGELTDIARRWSIGMAQQHAIFHNTQLDRQVRANWKKLGENVGTGPTVDDIFNAFLASPTHRANVVDPRFTKVGVGVVADASGQLYTAHEFMSLSGAKAKPKAKGRSRGRAVRRPARRR